MKTTSFRLARIACAAAAVAVCTAACGSYDETPPVASVYLTTYIMPDPAFLTADDRAVLTAEQDEYEAFLQAAAASAASATDR